MNKQHALKLSEIISGCESGAWLKGAIFHSEIGDIMKFDGTNIYLTYGNLNTQLKWGFITYDY